MQNWYHREMFRYFRAWDLLEKLGLVRLVGLHLSERKSIISLRLD